MAGFTSPEARDAFRERLADRLLDADNDKTYSIACDAVWSGRKGLLEMTDDELLSSGELWEVYAQAGDLGEEPKP